jgi:F-type H+-transporting ATPase subunit a
MTNIQLQPEYVLSFFGLPMTNTFLTSMIVTALLIAVSSWFYFHRQKRENFLSKVLRVLVFELLKLTDVVTQDRNSSIKILPLVATFFLFIVTANLLALIPGFLGSFFLETSAGRFPLVRSPNSDLTSTLALALVSVSAIQVFSFRTLGAKGYIKRFLNLTSPLAFILGFFETISEAVKVLSFSFRLFGNIFAGEVLLLVIAFLIPYIIPLPFMVLEVFVGIIQAFIFAVLTLTFIKTGSLQQKTQAENYEPAG